MYIYLNIIKKYSACEYNSYRFCHHYSHPLSSPVLFSPPLLRKKEEKKNPLSKSERIYCPTTTYHTTWQLEVPKQKGIYMSHKPLFLVDSTP